MIFRRPTRHVLFALGLGAIGAVVLAVLASPGRLADHWGTEWDAVPDADVPVRMRQLAELDDDGLATIAEALGNDRPAVARAAEDTLRYELDRWRYLPSRESAAKLSHLVRCLRKQSPHYGPKARRVAADLATQALLWPVDRQGPDRDRLVHDCANLIRAAEKDDWRPGEEEKVDDRGAAHVAANTPAREPMRVGLRPDVERRAGVIEPESPAPQPGGGLPIDAAQVPTVPSSPESGNELVGANPLRRPIPALEMEQADEGTQVNSSNGLFDQPAVADDSPPARFQPALSRRIPWQAPRRNDEAEPTESTEPPEPPGRRMGGMLTDRIDELVHQDDLTVMRQLHADDREQIQLAREELIRRGFDERHLQMAAALTNPDAKTRLRFAQTLPRIPDIDIRPWLKTLAADDNPDVRLAAIAVIATSGLPESSAWLRQIELKERDSRVKQQLTKVLNRR